MSYCRSIDVHNSVIFSWLFNYDIQGSQQPVLKKSLTFPCSFSLTLRNIFSFKMSSAERQKNPGLRKKYI